MSAVASFALALGMHVATAHTRGGHQGFNPGVYLRQPSGFTAGLYRNSCSAASAHVGWTWQTADQRWALTAGAVTGYPAAPLLPVLVPSVRIGLPAPGWDARLTLIPKPPRHGAGAGLHLSLETTLP